MLPNDPLISSFGQLPRGPDLWCHNIYLTLVEMRRYFLIVYTCKLSGMSAVHDIKNILDNFLRQPVSLRNHWRPVWLKWMIILSYPSFHTKIVQLVYIVNVCVCVRVRACIPGQSMPSLLTGHFVGKTNIISQLREEGYSVDLIAVDTSIEG